MYFKDLADTGCRVQSLPLNPTVFILLGQIILKLATGGIKIEIKVSTNS
jgi:hypothetical protein